MNYILTFLGSVLTFLGLDAIWIKFVAKPELDKIAGSYMKSPNVIAAGLFYIIYIGAVTIVALKFSNSPKEAAVFGFFLGFVSYATYELTNMSTLANWTWKMVILDTLWGGILTAAVSAVTYLIWAKLS
jgi:uncharacterized membrane protein